MLPSEVLNRMYSGLVYVYICNKTLLYHCYENSFMILCHNLTVNIVQWLLKMIMFSSIDVNFSFFSGNIKDTHSSGESSDSEDEIDIEGKDDKESEEEDFEDVQNTKIQSLKSQATENGTAAKESVLDDDESQGLCRPNRKCSTLPRLKSTSPDEKANHNNVIFTAKSDECLTSGSFDERIQNTTEKELKKKKKKNSLGFSFELPKRKTSKDTKKFSTASDPGVNTVFETAQVSCLSRKGAVKGPRLRKEETVKVKDAPGQKAWANRRFVFSVLF